ncbi:MAG: FkbM family methyltransferase [Bacteroidia bacterium]|nr:FkbM family methyltransferase [Bacteroidia bacterium]
MNTGIVTFTIKIINSIVNKLGIRIEFINTNKIPVTISKNRSETIEYSLNKLVEFNINEQFYFVQIGANDGYSFDPINHLIKKYNLKGVCIEPIQEYFQELKNTYKNYPNVSLLKAAVTDKIGNIEMYKVKKTDHNLPNWTKGIASIDINHHKKTNIKGDYIETEIVKSISFDKLIQRFKIDHIDLLVIDTEGYDLKIIEMIEFNKLKPKIIFFEHLYNYRNISDIKLGKTVTKFQDLGYLVNLGESEMLVYLP